MFRILHLADLHLGWTPRFMPDGLAAERRRRRDELLRRAVDLALDPSHRVGLVLIAGDLFDDFQPEGVLVGMVLRELRRLEAAGIPLVTVPGNHDEITYPGSVYQQQAGQWPGILVRNPMPAHLQTLTVGGVPIHLYSLAYTGGVTQTRPPLDHFPRLDEPGLHVGVFHGTLGDWGGDRSLPLDPAAVGRSGYDYMALGHIHQHQQHSLGRTLTVYAGAAEGKGFDDPGVGHFTLAEVQDGRITVRQAAVAVQPVRTLTVQADGLSDAAELEQRIARAADPEAVLRVRLTGDLPFSLDAALLAAALAPHFFYVEIVDETESIAPALLDTWAAEPTILGQYIRRLRARLAASVDAGEQEILQRALHRGVLALRGGRY